MEGGIMIQQLKQTENYRSYLDTKNGDVIMQGNPYCDRLFGYRTIADTFIEFPADDYGFYEVIIRGWDNAKYDPCSVSGDISHKRAICRILRGYTDDEVETLSKHNLNGILRDDAKADIRNASPVEGGSV